MVFDDSDGSIDSYMTWGIPYILHQYSEPIYVTLNVNYIKLMTSLACLDSPQHARYIQCIDHLKYTDPCIPNTFNLKLST